MTDMKDLFLEGDDLAGVRPAPARRGAFSRHNDDQRHIGCPLSWFRLVFPVVRGKNELAVAIYLYRLRALRHSRTVAVPNGFLAELGIERHAKYRALDRLEAAGLITVRRYLKRTIEITFRNRKRAVRHGHTRP
jgi:hypothetical protein